jgi:DNA-binding transcriptional ArsR family regulator
MNQANDHLSVTLAALADPTRRAILSRLASGEATVTELAEPFAISQPAVSRHLRVLEQAGLITRGRDAQRRPSRLVGRPLREVVDWVEQYRQFWDQQLIRLDRYLREEQQEEPPRKSGRKPARKPKREKHHGRKRK